MAVEVVVPTRVEHPPVADDPMTTPADGQRPGTGPRWLLPTILGTGVIALLACLLAGGTVGTGTVSGLPDAGPGTRWALPVASFVAESAAVLGFGAALLAAVLIPFDGGPQAASSRIRALSTAGLLSFLAAAAGVVVFVLTLSDLTARPLPQALDAAEAVQLASFGPGRLLLVSTALSLLGGMLAVGTRRRLCRATSTTTTMATDAGRADRWR